MNYRELLEAAKKKDEIIRVNNILNYGENEAMFKPRGIYWRRVWQLREVIKKITTPITTPSVLVEGDVNLTHLDDLVNSISWHPKLTITGDLILTDSLIKKLPDNLTVEGRLFLANTKIKKLPANLSVHKWIDLTGTPLLKNDEELKKYKLQLV